MRADIPPAPQRRFAPRRGVLVTRRRICAGCGCLTQGRGRCDQCRVDGGYRARPLWPDPRSTSRWNTLRLRLCGQAQDCDHCGGPLDHQAPGRSRYAPSLDHIVPVSRGGDWYDEANLRVVHFGCNSSLGAKLARR